MRCGTSDGRDGVIFRKADGRFMKYGRELCVNATTCARGGGGAQANRFYAFKIYDDAIWEILCLFALCVVVHT